MSPRSRAKTVLFLMLTAASLVVGWNEAAAEEPALTEAHELADEAANGASCTYGLAQAPPEGERLCVYFDNAESPLPENARNGWTYNRARNVVTFHGSSCEGIQTGRVRDVDIICGCERR